MHSANLVLAASCPGAALSVDFIGSGITWIGSRGPNQGSADVYIDGQWVATVDQYSAVEKPQDKTFEISNIDFGHHILLIVKKQNSSELVSDGFIDVDAFDVFR